MARTWIVVAHRAGYRLLECTNDSNDLTLLEEFDHPEGRMQDHEILSDEQGRSYSSWGVGQSQFSRHETAHDHESKAFAAQITQKLETARHDHKFDDVVLVAEPRFLGYLREHLPPPLEKVVRGSVDKDLYLIPVRDIPQHLGSVLRPR